MVKIIFKTDKYEASHGKKPRGTGNWMFNIKPYGAPDWNYSAHGTYAEAKKLANVFARKFTKDEGCNVAELIVLP